MVLGMCIRTILIPCGSQFPRRSVIFDMRLSYIADRMMIQQGCKNPQEGAGSKVPHVSDFDKTVSQHWWTLTVSPRRLAIAKRQM